MKLDHRLAEQAARRRPARTDDDDELLSLRDLLAKLWSGRWIVLGTMTLLVALAALGVSRMPDQYLATASVMFGTQKANVVDLEDILADPVFSKDTLQNEVQVLRSTSLLERVISELKLQDRPEFNPTLRPGSRLAWLRRSASSDPAGSARKTRQLVVEELRRRLTLTPIEGTRVIEIGFLAPDPETAASVVNTIADQYIVDQLVAKTQATRSAIDWLTSRVAEARQQVRDAEGAVESLRAELAGEAGQGIGITEQQLGALNGALSAARSRTSEVEARHDRLQAALAPGGDMAGVSEFRASGLILTYRAEEADLAERLRSISPNHPAVPQLRAELADLRAKIRAEAESIAAASGSDLEAARAQEASLAASVHALETKALGQSREQIKLRQLDREAEASRLIYETMLNRLKETSEQVELQAADARILSPADAPLTPESERKQLILALAAAFGLLGGVGLVFLRDQLDASFRSPKQIEALTGYTVLATIPGIRRRRRGRPDAVRQLRERPSSSLAESVRNLRTSLLYASGAHPPTVLLFTSSVPGEGKTTTAMLTALTGCQMGKSAIIVDCDLHQRAARQPEAHGPGLRAVLDGSASLADAIHADPDTGLHFLAARPVAGAPYASPADILASEGFAALIRRLAEHYDLVVLDAPPALVVTDARILSAISDSVVYAVRWGRTPRGAVLEGLKELRSVDAPIAGIVLTMIDEARAARHAVDGYVYYRGRFRDYYVD